MATYAEARPQVARWIGFGALFGMVAGVVFAMFEMVVAWLMGEGFWMPMRMIGAIILGEQALEPTYSLATAAIVGAVLHMAFSALYGIVFAAIAATISFLRESRGGLVVAATVYGLVLWLVNFQVIAPALFPWFQEANQLLQGFVAHTFLYGTVLGFLLATLQGRSEEAQRRERLGHAA